MRSMPAVGCPASTSSCRISAGESLSHLSSVMKMLPWRSGSNPHQLAMAPRSRRSLIRTVSPSSPRAPSASVVARISSISAISDATPRMSMSHWVNCR